MGCVCDSCRRELGPKAAVWRFARYDRNLLPRLDLRLHGRLFVAVNYLRVHGGWQDAAPKRDPRDPRGTAWRVATLCRPCVRSHFPQTDLFAFWCEAEPCVTCGRAVTNASNLRHLITTCSRICRRQAYTKRHPPVRRPRVKLPCAQCGHFFVPQRSEGRFCGVKCRVAAWRQRRRSAA
jgi:hypothetical protein